MSKRLVIGRIIGCKDMTSLLFKAVVNTVGGLPRGVFFAGYRSFFLFLADRLGRKHPFKHATKNKGRGLLHCTSNL